MKEEIYCEVMDEICERERKSSTTISQAKKDLKRVQRSIGFIECPDNEGNWTVVEKHDCSSTFKKQKDAMIFSELVQVKAMFAKLINLLKELKLSKVTR